MGKGVKIRNNKKSQKKKLITTKTAKIDKKNLKKRIINQYLENGYRRYHRDSIDLFH